MRRFSPTALASASPARTYSAAPSVIAMPCCTTPTTGAGYLPLQPMPQARAAFEIHNSPLTENATIGFEFGYNVQAPSRLVIWEAQYGDFINGAQIDHRRVHRVGARQVGTTSVAGAAAAARARRARGRTTRARGRSVSCSWPPTSTCASPTARRRRSTSTCCGGRRRCCSTDPLPLVVLTPKSLLRHPLVASTPRELAEGRFQQ